MWPWNTKSVIIFIEMFIWKLMYGLLGWDNIWLIYKKINIEKIAFKVVQMKFLVMHITSQKFCF